MKTALFSLLLVACAKSAAVVTTETPHAKQPTTLSFDEEHAGTSVDVPLGAEFRVDLAASSDTLPPRYQFERLPPEVHGDAVKLVRTDTVGPTPGAAGARGRDVFVFKAVAKGDARIVCSKSVAIDPPYVGRPVRTRKLADYSLRVAVK